jgi:hypothetical protein
MGNASALGQRHLVGTDVEAAVHGRRIAADDFAAAPQRELDAERALARRRRSENRKDRRAQTLGPEHDDADHDPEQNQEAELLLTRWQRHRLT